MTDDPGLITQLQQNWESIATGVGASIASIWTMLKAHARRIDRVESKADSLEEQKATRDELNRTVESLRRDMAGALDRMQNSNSRIYQRIDDLYMLLLSKADDRLAKQMRENREPD